SRSVVCGYALDVRMISEKSFALSEGHRVGRNLRDALKRRARNSDQIMHNRNDDFGLDVQSAGNQQVVGAVNGSCQTIFNRSENIIGDIILDAGVKRLERESRDELNVFAQ